MGCGTGIIGEVLANVGYTRLAGIDASEKMIEKAKEKNIYYEIDELQSISNLIKSHALLYSFEDLTHILISSKIDLMLLLEPVQSLLAIALQKFLTRFFFL